MKIKYKRILLIVWTVIIFVLISFPMPEYKGDVVTLYDKYAHIFMFGVFTFLVAANLWEKFNTKFIYLFFLSATAGILYSGLSECIQVYVPGRDVSEYDFLAGIIGVFAAEIIVYVQYGKKA